MCSDVAIRASKVGKCYQIHDKSQDRPKPSLLRSKKQAYRDFWAVQEVSFELNKGEMLGIIGRNGSGKSTLLQMICGTLRPTTGEIQTTGRIAALLELGAGFNPQFSGSENIYTNGTILGLKRAEIDARYDEIVAFADIGNFIDQPVKTYSSGMFVRLAFAVQACVEPDILVVDEALAVGDVFFRQKCYKRLAQLRDRGCSVILVTHGMGDVEQFCQHGLLLDHGQALFHGPASEAVKRYYLVDQEQREAAMALTASEAGSDAGSPHSNSGDFWPGIEAYLNIRDVAHVSNGWARCVGLAICNEQNQPCRNFHQGETACFFYEFEVLSDIEVPIAGLVIQNDKGVIVHGKSTLEYGSEMPQSVAKGARLRFRQDICLEIAGGQYTFEIGMAAISRADYAQRADLSYRDLLGRQIRLCHLPAAGRFSVMLRPAGIPVALTHHGIANLPGQCQLVNFTSAATGKLPGSAATNQAGVT